jgi:hypothetical protein
LGPIECHRILHYGSKPAQWVRDFGRCADRAVLGSWAGIVAPHQRGSRGAGLLGHG